MRDKFQFSDGQDLGALASSGVKSTDWWNLEQDVTVDQYIEGWIHIIILTCTQDSGDSGLDILLASSDNTDLTTGAQYLGGIRLIETELVAGNQFCFGVAKGALNTYLGMWYAAVSESLNNATTLDAYFQSGPLTSPGAEIQKRPS